MVQRAYKFRFYPTAEQKEILFRQYGTARWVWNWALSVRSQAYRQGGQSLSGVDLSRRLTPYKKTAGFAWIKETPSTVLSQTLRDQDTAFKNFFAGRAKYPKFKSRRHAYALRFQLDQRTVMNNFRVGELLKVPGLGSLKLKWSRLPGGVPKMVTVRRDAAGRYFVSFSVEEHVDHLPKLSNVIGIDVGFKDICVTSSGEKSGNPKFYRSTERRLRLAQRSLSRKTKGSGRWQKQRLRVTRLHARMVDQRNDFLHKLTTTLIRENQAICVEDLCVKGMQRNGFLGKSVGDAALFELRRQLSYKAEFYGRDLMVVDRFAPTSKSCSDCGHKMDEMPLNVREWECPKCGTEHDRDINAALNVLIYGTGGTPGAAASAGKARGGETIPCGIRNIPIAPAPDIETRINQTALS